MTKLLADPGEARGCSTNSLVINSFIDSFSLPFPPTALRIRHAQAVRDSTSSYKIDYVHSDQELSQSRRASKSHQWFKSYSHFAERVDFAYWWSFSGGGSALQPSQRLFVEQPLSLPGSANHVQLILKGVDEVNIETKNDNQL